MSLQGVFANIGINILNVSLSLSDLSTKSRVSVSREVDLLDYSPQSSKSLEGPHNQDQIFLTFRVYIYII